MDNSAHLSTPEWSTPRAAGYALLAGGVILLVTGILAASDPVGLFLMGLAGLLLFVFGIRALVLRPRLAIGATGGVPSITVRTLRGRHTYSSARIHRIRVLNLRRIGRQTGQLEIDVLHDDAPATDAGLEDALRDDTRLLVFSRWDLGADVGSVADELRRAGFDVEDGRD